jgi:ADP-heptose:LPS heptosyltransferase
MPLTIPKPSSIVLVRTDEIGDNIIFSAAIPHLSRRFGDAPITIVCQEHVAPLYQHCPLIARVIPFSRPRATGEPGYLDDLLRQIRACEADLCLNMVFSREALGDELVLQSQAGTTIAYRGNADNISPEAMATNNARYTHLIDTPSDGSRPEIDRYRDFLAALDADVPSLTTQIWSSPDDRTAARQILQQHGIDPTKLVVLFAAGQFTYKNYPRFGTAIAELCREQDLHVVALGGQADYELNQRCLDAIATPTANLCGKTSLLESAEVLRACRVAVGTDTGLAHTACAVGARNVIALGGGHFGRFLPYSPLTSIVTLPLECFGCNWRCRYLWPHCVKDIAPEVLELAVRDALSRSSDRIRVWFQDRSLWTRVPLGPVWSPRVDLLPRTGIDVAMVGVQSMQPHSGMTQITVTRRFRQPFIGRWVSGMARAMLRPLARAIR